MVTLLCTIATVLVMCNLIIEVNLAHRLIHDMRAEKKEGK